MQVLRGDGAAVTDPITCPECDGVGYESLDALRLACRFCGGRGWVGGEYEPAEVSENPPASGPPPAWEHRVWHDRVTSGIDCRFCLDAGRVAHVNGGVLVSAPCPACR